MNVDTISDSITRIRNGLMAKKQEIEILCSKEVLGILEVLKTEGYIESYAEFDVRKGIKKIKVGLKYFRNEPTIKEIKRLSKPSRRLYSSSNNLPIVYNGLGISVLSTSQGIMSSMEAKKRNIGGEVLCSVF